MAAACLNALSPLPSWGLGRGPPTPVLCVVPCEATALRLLTWRRPAWQWYQRRSGLLAAARRSAREPAEGSEDRKADILQFLGGLGFEGEEAERILKRGQLALSRVSTLEERAAALESLAFTKEELNLIISRAPLILNYSPDTLKASAGILQELFGLTPLQVKEALLRNPDSMGRLEVLREAVPYLLDLGVSKVDLGQIFLKFPRIMQYVRGNVQELQALRGLGFSKQEIAAAIMKHPPLLSAKGARHYLQLVSAMHERFGTDAETCRKLVLALPQYICLDTATVIQKVDYLVKVMGRDVQELLSYPKYISCSLEDRIKPRYEACVRDGVTHLSLSTILGPGDATFEVQKQRRREKALARAARKPRARRRGFKELPLQLEEEEVTNGAALSSAS